MRFFSFLCVFATSLSAFAGGSILREDALATICRESRTACVIANKIKLDPVGFAVRRPSGERILPYEFHGELDGTPVRVVFQYDEQGAISVSLY